MSELITLPEGKKVLEIFSEKDGLIPYIEMVESEAAKFVGSVETKAAREEMASFAHKITRSKTYLDAAGKALVDEMKDLPKRIDANRKAMRDRLDALRDKVRLPLTQFEQAEQARAERAKNIIQGMAAQTYGTTGLSSKAITQRIDELQVMTFSADDFPDGTEGPEVARSMALQSLAIALVAAQEKESMTAELDRLRAEAEARMAAMPRPIPQPDPNEDLHNPVINPSGGGQPIKQDAAGDAKRAHMAGVHQAMLAAFFAGGLSQADAKTATILLAKGAIPNTKITY